MAAWLPALAAIGPMASSAYGTMGNIYSTRETNKANLEIANRTNQSNYDIAQETSAFNAREAQKNRDFQALQSASAYQTAVADMRKAGLNPALAYSQGGAQAMSGSTAQGVSSTMQAPRMEKVDYGDLSAGVSSALQANMAERQFAETRVMNASALQTQISQQESNNASAKQSEAAALKLDQDRANSIAELGLKTNDQDLKKIAQDQTLLNQKQQIELQKQQIWNLKADAEYTRSNKRKTDVQIPGLEAESNWTKEQSDYKTRNSGWIVPLSQTTESVGRVMDGISSAINIFDKFLPSKSYTTRESYDARGEHRGSTTTTHRKGR